MTVENNIFIFANTYSCPLDKRCDSCVFSKLCEIEKTQLYKSILDMDNATKDALVVDCQKCQRQYESVNV
ncbi:MAG: hypothetical protein NE327_13595 [Lentisphaeraceae bacterium]|nr:hypothetical protein [Lentisphaeraceae bacterium]